MLFCMMTYIENFHFVWFKIYNDKLVQHNKAILNGYKSKENKTVTDKGGWKIHWRKSKGHLEVDEYIV